MQGHGRALRRSLCGAILACALPAGAATSGGADPASPTNTGSTYFVATGGSDSASGFAGSPWRTFAKAWEHAISGDTIVVADGEYTAASPPPGKSGLLTRPISVRAANPSRARLDLLRFRGNSHLSFHGFRIAGDTEAVVISSNGPGKPSHHLAFHEIGFSCAPETLNDSACFSLFDGTHHVLVEDSWGWGGGRYTIKCYGGPGGRPPNLTCDNNTFRRLVLRMGPARSSPGNPQASLALYYSSGNLVENVVAIDGRAASDSSNSAFYVTAHAPPPGSNRNRFLGVIALGNQGAGLWLDCPGAVCDDLEVRGSVFWASTTSALIIAGGRCLNAVIDNNTMAASGSKGHGFVNHKCDGATFTNNALYRNAGYGARQSPSGGSTPTAHHNGYFGNAAGARQGIAAGGGDLTTDPRFAYVTRIEESSPYRNAGGTKDVGASVVQRYVDGRPTTTPLWPWPHEERLRAEMCASPSPGFCASGNTLTRYVWEFLGRPLPAGIYR